MNTRRLTLMLPADIYQKLEQDALREERDPTQQARVILRRALTKSGAAATITANDQQGGGDDTTS
jgi:hypothetical protein